MDSFIPLYGDVKMNTVWISFPFLSSWMTPSNSLVCPLFFFLSSIYPNSAHRQEEAGCRFKGPQGENKSSFHNVRINVEF